MMMMMMDKNNHKQLHSISSINGGNLVVVVNSRRTRRRKQQQQQRSLKALYWCTLISALFMLGFGSYSDHIFLRAVKRRQQDRRTSNTSTTTTSTTTEDSSFRSSERRDDKENEPWSLPLVELERKQVLGRRNHRQCLLSSNWFDYYNPKTRRSYLDLYDKAGYIKHNDPPKYDHESCFVMKARYNCAGNQSSTGTIAPQWKLSLTTTDASASASTLTPPPTTSALTCDLRTFIEDINGPAGIAKNYILKNKNNDGATTGTASIDVFNVVMHGNSYLRQTWESLVCTWQHQITSLILYQGGISMAQQDLLQRKTKIQYDEYGRFLYYNHNNVTNNDIPGCHGGTYKWNEKFYYNADDVPKTTLDECSDDIVMVEFGNAIRFHYVFRPQMYQNLSQVYMKLGLQPQNIHQFVFNDNSKQTYPKDIAYKLKPGVLDSSNYEWGMMQTWKQIQMRDVGVWTGCDNPFIRHAPDKHPCMPGVPDDESNLLLFLLLHSHGNPNNNSIIKNHTLIGGVKLLDGDAGNGAGQWGKHFAFLQDKQGVE